MRERYQTFYRSQGLLLGFFRLVEVEQSNQLLIADFLFLVRLVQEKRLLLWQGFKPLSESVNLPPPKIRNQLIDCVHMPITISHHTEMSRVIYPFRTRDRQLILVGSYIHKWDIHHLDVWAKYKQGSKHT